MACKPLIFKKKREKAVRPPSDTDQGTIAPLNADIGDLEEAQEAESVTAEESNQWEELANKYEDLAQKVHEYIDSQTSAEHGEG